MIDVRFRRRIGATRELNIAPLIDMVFILLIFFIVTTSFVKETGVSIDKPQAATAQQLEKGNILIAVSKLGTIHMENRTIDLRSVRPLVKQGLREVPGASVIILADKESHTGLVIQVMDEAKLAGAKQVSVAAKKTD